MKSTCSKRGMMSLLSGFFLVGFLLLTGTRAEAQDLNNWLQSDQAKTALETEARAIHTDIPNLSGSALNDAKAHLYYYVEIYGRISGGEAVASAVPVSLTTLFSETSKPTDVTVDQSLKDQLYADASLLLTQ